MKICMFCLSATHELWCPYHPDMAAKLNPAKAPTEPTPDTTTAPVDAVSRAAVLRCLWIVGGDPQTGDYCHRNSLEVEINALPSVALGGGVGPQQSAGLEASHTTEMLDE